MREKAEIRDRRINLRLRLACGAGAMALALFAAAAPAGALTLGQLAPAPNPPSVCSNTDPFDSIQPTVTAGDAYVVPSTGGVTAWTVSSWSHNAGPGAGQTLELKFFRKVAEPATWQAVVHDGPRNLTPSTPNTFGGLNLSVTAGDVLGLNDGAVANACFFAVAGETHLERNGDLADGASGPFNTSGNRLNITAEVNPTNTFTLGGVTRNKNKGTATLTATVPNPGNLTAGGKGIKSATAVESKAVGAGVAKLTIRAKGKKKQKLNDTGKVKLNVKVAYTPTGGTARTVNRTVKLKKNL